jgi:TonB family protein
MRDLVFPDSSGSGLFDHDTRSSQADVRSTTSLQEPGNLEVLELLRRSLEDDNQSTDSLLTAVTEAARVLTGADAAALALLQNGMIVCRARSGPIGPELGAPLNTDSGISGECLRSATILVSTDTLRDERVNPDVCQSLGIRSLAVVPLRGLVGMVGVLEAFSGRPGAFENEQIDSLRSLAEITERAYEREQRLLQHPASLTAGHAPLRVAIAAAGRRGFTLLSRVVKKDFRIIMAAAVAVLLISLVVWTSLRKTQAEIAASEAAPRTQASPLNVARDNPAQAVSKGVPRSAPVRPAPNRSNEPASGSLLQKAAELSPEANRPVNSGVAETANPGITVSRGTQPVSKQPPPEEPPPAVDLATSSSPSALTSVVSTTPPLPPFQGPVSQATEAKLMRRVEPAYPGQARIQRLEGSVVLDAIIGADGTVRSTKVVSGPAPLAEAAAAAVRSWRYSPAILDGKPTEAQTRITVVFKLP